MDRQSLQGGVMQQEDVWMVICVAFIIVWVILLGNGVLG